MTTGIGKGIVLFTKKYINLKEATKYCSEMQVNPQETPQQTQKSKTEQATTQRLMGTAVITTSDSF